MNKMKKILKKIATLTIRLVLIISIVIQNMFYGLPLLKMGVKSVEASNSLVKTSVSDWAAGKFEYNEILATSSGEIRLQGDLGTWEASGAANVNLYANGYTKMLKVGKFLYLFRNKGLGQLLRYDFETREWKEMALMPIAVNEVMDATTNGTDTIYAFATRATGPSLYRHFMKYDIPTDTWTLLADTPNFLNAAATLEYVGPNYIYAMRGGTYDLWRYTINTNT